jgi:NitT/TauT family transport system substrate-binding protein
MGKKWSLTGLLLAVALLLTVAAGCGGNAANDTAGSSAPASSGSSAPTELVKVKFSEVIRSIFYAPHYVAMSQGFFQKHGLDVDMTTAQGSDKGAAALIAGTADISLVGPETAIYIYNQNGDKKLKVFYQMTMRDGSFLLSRNKTDSFQWSDLAGKKIIGWRPGSSPQMVMNSTLNREKVQGAEVVTNIASTAMAGAFTSGQGDYIQLFEPIASTLIQQGKAYYVASMGDAFGAYPETSYMATEDYIAKHSDVIKEFTEAVAEATRWLDTASDEEIAKALRPFFDGTPDDILIQSIHRYKDQDTWPLKPELTADSFETLQNVLIENGVLKPEEKLADLSAIADMSFVDALSQAG